MRLFLFITFILTLSPSGFAASMDDVEMKATHIAGTVFMMEGRGGNIGVSIGDDGTLIVDDQFAPLAGKIEAALKKLGGDRPKLILNTHYHGDHTGSNPEFGTTGTIISHDNVRVRLLAMDDFPRSGLPLITYDQNVTVHFNDDTIELIHLPNGHTDGDTAVWFKKADVLHLGDHFFNGRFPYIDVPAGGSVDGFIANNERILTLVNPDTQIIPGHGPLATPDDLRTTIDAVKKTSRRITRALERGESIDDIAKAIDSDFPGWGSGFINAGRWVQIVQEGASGRR